MMTFIIMITFIHSFILYFLLWEISNMIMYKYESNIYMKVSMSIDNMNWKLMNKILNNYI